MPRMELLDSDSFDLIVRFDDTFVYSMDVAIDWERVQGLGKERFIVDHLLGDFWISRNNASTRQHVEIRLRFRHPHRDFA